MCIGWWCDAERRLSPRASFSTEKLRARLAPAVECVGCFSRRGEGSCSALRDQLARIILH